MEPPFRSRPRIRTQPPDDDIVDGTVSNEQALVPLELPPPPRRRRRSRRVPRLRLASPGTLILAAACIVGGIFFTLLNVTDLPDPVLGWWPAVSLAAALVWALVALVKRDAAAFLSGAGVAGLSISLLLDTQSVAPFEETVVGVVLVALGLAIMMRGLLLRSTVTG